MTEHAAARRSVLASSKTWASPASHPAVWNSSSLELQAPSPAPKSFTEQRPAVWNSQSSTEQHPAVCNSQSPINQRPAACDSSSFIEGQRPTVWNKPSSIEEQRPAVGYNPSSIELRPSPPRRSAPIAHQAEVQNPARSAFQRFTCGWWRFSASSDSQSLPVTLVMSPPSSSPSAVSWLRRGISEEEAGAAFNPMGAARLSVVELPSSIPMFALEAGAAALSSLEPSMRANHDSVWNKHWLPFCRAIGAAPVLLQIEPGPALKQTNTWLLQAFCCWAVRRMGTGRDRGAEIETAFGAYIRRIVG